MTLTMYEKIAFRCDDEKVIVVTEAEVLKVEGYIFTYVRRE